MTLNHQCNVNRELLLHVENLSVEFLIGRHRKSFFAVDDVSLKVSNCETVGLVGESGSGKTTIGRSILGLEKIGGGSVQFKGVDITRASYKHRRELSSDLQAVFQDPYSSLNPTRTIGQSLAEPMQSLHRHSKSDISSRVDEMLQRVGLSAGARLQYPYSFSGGQRQRIAIARALMTQPSLVICDEPLSALDLSVQAQMLNLFQDLQDEFQLSYVFIAHDLSVVRRVSHAVVVLYRGRIMESGPASVVCSQPLHPYTRALLDAAPVPDPVLQRSRRLKRTSTVVSSGDTSGNMCPFASRCEFAIDKCRQERPTLEQTTTDSKVACHRWRELPSYRGAS